MPRIRTKSIMPLRPREPINVEEEISKRPTSIAEREKQKNLQQNPRPETEIANNTFNDEY